MTDTTHTKRILYTGLHLPPPAVWGCNEEWIHYPLISIRARDRNSAEICAAFALLPRCTHLVFTSKTAVDLFCSYIDPGAYAHLPVFSVGQATAEKIRRCGLKEPMVAADETAEGVTALILRHCTPEDFLFWPHAAGAREVLPQFFKKHSISYCDCVLYDTIPLRPDPLPELANFDAVYFTSPSTARAFFSLFPAPPPHLIFRSQGPITAAAVLSPIA